MNNLKIENNLYISSNLITNFKPNIFNNNIIYKKNTSIVCRNFLIYLLLIKYKNNNFLTKSCIFIKKQKKNTYTILRAPYRHKLSRHQISFSRYHILSSIVIKHFNVKIKNYIFLVNTIDFFKKSNKFFESNIIYLNNIKIKFNFSYKNNFIINNFIK